MKKIILLVLWLPFFFLDLSAQTDTLRVYGPGGPYPAFKNLAEEYEKQHNVKVILTKGPVSNWKEEAQQDADIIYSGSEDMMADFMEIFENQIDANSIYPLYFRNSGLIVRKGNPKKIRRIEDLQKDSLQIMIVKGAGLRGMWEDMLGKLKSKKRFRKIRKNIVVFAGNSGVAEKKWKENPEIDVWMTWNIWQMANESIADFVKVKRKYTVSRNCGIALTENGKEHKEAIRFYEFVKSKEAETIFNQNGWH